jgi:hypothetical protein
LICLKFTSEKRKGDADDASNSTGH